MQKIVCLWVWLLGLGWAAQAQSAASACGNGRYVDHISADADSQATSGVLFGRNTVCSYTTNTEGSSQDLRLDVYAPAGGGATQRQLLPFAFGGAFIIGSGTDAQVVSICRRFTRKGHVAAIDMRAAVRYFKYDAAGANAYHIDPTRILVGDYPAGAITALQVAYTDTDTESSDAAVNAAYATYGGLEGNTDLPGTPLLGTYTSKCAAPLPVTLTSFSGRVAPDDCTATLTWQTATERNSYAYEVQGSSDGQAFAALGTVPSRNRVAGAAYSFRVGRLAELRYFRLRMLDTDGTAAYSSVVTLTGCAAGPLLVAPTPTRDQATVSGLPAGRCLGVLYSATGQVVAQASGTTTISLRLSGLPPGIYLLKVQSESGATVGTTKVVKE